ncbi:MAG: glycosyltransferase family 39 protein, partial [Candidatus Levybacteria bacterium]|nr:glycosyltransferase family 39 protein [Candidatus Levybacteria bacterium]
MISRVLKKDIKFLITLFIVWKIWVIVFLLFAVVFIPLRLHFLGGGLEHYLRLPWFWAWGNFDGEHYLAIAQHGYGNGEQAFFPLYPVLMRLLVWPFRGDVYFLQAAGLFISNFAFFLTLLGLWKLVRLDFKKSIAELTIILLLAFPTSFYFGSVYTESLFFALIVWSFYAARRGWWLLSGILGGLSTATRFLGIILLPVLMIEWFIQRKNHKSPASRQGGPVTNHQSLFLFFIPLGLFTYMYYLYQTTGDPFAFFHTLTGFGEQRSSTPILLLQVFWRYFKITMDINIRDPFFFTFLLEAG